MSAGMPNSNPHHHPPPPSASATHFSRKVYVDIFRELQCPGCSEIMEPPIYLCAKGHSVCSRCTVRYSECPTCQMSFLNAKNETLEALMKHFAYPCKNLSCEKMVYLNERQNHESDCEHRMIKCFLLNCNWEGVAQKLKFHASRDDDHPCIHSTNIALKFSIPEEGYSRFTYILSHDHLFVFNVKRDRGLFLCLRLIGTKSKASQFGYTVTLRSTAPASSVTSSIIDNVIQLKGTVHNDLEDIEQKCIKLPPSDWLRERQILGTTLPVELYIEYKSTNQPMFQQ